MFASPINVDPWVTADDVTVTHLENQRVTFQGAINSADGALLQNGTVSASKLDANANPENRWNEAFNDFVFTGLIPVSSDTSLVAITTAGTAYIYGARVVKDATSKTYTASKDTYVDLSKTGTFTYSEVNNGSPTPSVASNSIRLALVSADTSIFMITDKRVRTIALATGEAAPVIDKIKDVDGNTQVQTEKNSNENIIRFDTDGTERMTIGATGIVNINNLSVSQPVFTDASKNLVSITGDTALNALLPSQVGNSGKFLTTDATNTSWGTAGSGFGNVVFCWFGSVIGATNTFGLKGGTSLTPNMSTYTVDYEFFGVYGTTYRTILTGKFTKIEGINTITVCSQVWGDAGAGTEPWVKVDIGGQNSEARLAVGSSTPGWMTPFTVDVSSLSDGTVYDITIQLHNDSGTHTAYCSAIMLTGS